MTNPLQLPFNLPHTVEPEVHEAFRFHANAILDVQQAILGPGGLLSQIKALKSGSSSSTGGTTVIQNTETVIAGSSAMSGTVNDQAGVTAYSTQQSDNGALVLLADASPVALTLTAGLTIPWWVFVVNQGAGLVTATPSAGTINGVADITLATGYFAIVAYDGTNFWALTAPIGPQNTPAVVHEWLASYNAVTGAFTQTQPVYADIGGPVPTWNQNTTGTAANLSGTPLLPNGTMAATQSPGDTSSDLATDAFVAAAVATLQPALLTGTSFLIGGFPMTVGQTLTTTVTIATATTSMVAVTSPVTYPGAGFVWDAYVSAANTVTVRLTCTLAGTPVASQYNVRVIQ